MTLFKVGLELIQTLIPNLKSCLMDDGKEVAKCVFILNASLSFPIRHAKVHLAL